MKTDELVEKLNEFAEKKYYPLLNACKKYKKMYWQFFKIACKQKEEIKRLKKEIQTLKGK